MICLKHYFKVCPGEIEDMIAIVDKNGDGDIFTFISTHIFYQIFSQLGPGRPSAGGPRMDGRAVTSLGIVKISRLASRLRRSARRGPEPEPGRLGPKLPRDQHAARKDPLIRKRHVTHRLPGKTL